MTTTRVFQSARGRSFSLDAHDAEEKRFEAGGDYDEHSADSIRKTYAFERRVGSDDQSAFDATVCLHKGAFSEGKQVTFGRIVGSLKRVSERAAQVSRSWDMRRGSR